MTLPLSVTTIPARFNSMQAAPATGSTAACCAMLSTHLWVPAAIATGAQRSDLVVILWTMLGNESRASARLECNALQATTTSMSTANADLAYSAVTPHCWRSSKGVGTTDFAAGLPICLESTCAAAEGYCPVSQSDTVTVARSMVSAHKSAVLYALLAAGVPACASNGNQNQDVAAGRTLDWCAPARCDARR